MFLFLCYFYNAILFATIGITKTNITSPHVNIDIVNVIQIVTGVDVIIENF